MHSDIFGNLMDWGEVLEKLEGLRNSETLDEHQVGLLRILRYPRNWRLREAALGVIREINQPSKELVNETLSIALNDDVYIEARTMAIDVLGDLMIRDRRIRTKNEIATRSRVLEKMERLMNNTHSPLLREGVERFFKKLANRKAITAFEA